MLVGYNPDAVAALPVHPVGPVDPDVRDHLLRRRRRPVARPRRAHDDPHLDLAARLVRADPDPGEGVHDLVPHPRGGDDRRVRRPGPVPVLHLLGAGPRPDVPDHRDLGRQEPDLRDDQVRPVHARRVAADAGRDPRHGVHLPGRDRHLDRGVRRPAAHRVRPDRRVRRAVRDPRLRRVLPRVRDQGPDVPVPHLAARRARRGADRGLGDPGRRAAQAGRLRVHPVRAAAVPRGRRTRGRR